MNYALGTIFTFSTSPLATGSGKGPEGKAKTKHAVSEVWFPF